MVEFCSGMEEKLLSMEVHIGCDITRAVLNLVSIVNLVNNK